MKLFQLFPGVTPYQEGVAVLQGSLVTSAWIRVLRAPGVLSVRGHATAARGRVTM